MDPSALLSVACVLGTGHRCSAASMHRVLKRTHGLGLVRHVGSRDQESFFPPTCRLQRADLCT